MHVVVTGASSGIGEAIARAYGARGASVTLIARREERLRQLADTLPGSSHVAPVDLLDLDAATEWIEAAEAKLGPIDVLVNNAGMQIVDPFTETESVDGERVIRLDLLAPMRLSRAILPAMLARGRGTIVDLVSLAAIAPTPYMAYYNAAKGGYGAFSEGLRGELRGTGVHVLTVYPGPVKTAMADAALEVYGEMPGPIPTGTTEELARRICRAVDRRCPRLIYPRFYWLARWFPGTTRFLMDRLTPRPKAAADA